MARIAKAVLRLFARSDNGRQVFLTPATEETRIFSLNSGRAALWLILKALSSLRPAKREVIIPAYTCPAVASAVLRAGLQPVLTDIDLGDIGIERAGLEKATGERTLAVITVRFLGLPGNLRGISEWCRQNDVFLVEDSAQAFGNTEAGPKADDDRVDARFFSFGRGKPLSVLHGGIAVTLSTDISRSAADVFRGLRKPSAVSAVKYALMLGTYLPFSHPGLYRIPQSLPFLHLGETIFEPEFDVSGILRFPELVLGEMADLVNREREMRAESCSWYREAFKGVAGIKEPPLPSFPYLRYPLIVEKAGLRDPVLAELKRHGTGAALLYPSPLNELPGLREVLRDMAVYGNAKILSERLITLPVHSMVTPRCRETIKSVVVDGTAPMS